MTATPSAYIGRFAPSPTGPLHFGSLVAALASFLDARARGGRWLLRMEDLDPPREVPGAAHAILASLQAHALHWDGEVIYQSERGDAYRNALRNLDERGLLYPCYCSRRDVMVNGGRYDGRCRTRTLPGQALAALAEGPPASLRVRTSAPSPAIPQPSAANTPINSCIRFDDLILGPQQVELADRGDFILLRKDGYFAYQLAVVVDDADQGISHVLRGRDLLSSTAAQIYLFRLLGLAEPRYGHLPLVTDAHGQKLSKQQGAPALDDSRATDNLLRALRFLGQTPPAGEQARRPEQVLSWASAHWQPERIPPSS